MNSCHNIDEKYGVIVASRMKKRKLLLITLI